LGLGAILYFGFDMMIDEETAEMGTRMIAYSITGIFVIWGTAAPFISKLRQQKEFNEQKSQKILSKIRSKVTSL
jgi:hypothetical protein